MHFRSIGQLSAAVNAALPRIPATIDLVVGIPRSGMLVASMIALARNLPLADLDGFLEGRTFLSGSTRNRERSLSRPPTHVLVVDDSCRTGAAMLEAREKLDSALPDLRYTTCVAYGVDGLNPGVDLVLEIVPQPRVFEWNVLHHTVVDRACLDIDGVLCLDPTETENDDGEGYLRFLLNAVPLHRPRRRIGTLVTSRLEKYRPQTEEWLARHEISYGSLVMLDCPDAKTRRELGLHGSFKAKVYAALDSPLFIESELDQARQIARLSGKPVLSLEGMEMCQPDRFGIATIRQQTKPRHLLKKLGGALLGEQGKYAVRQLRSRLTS